MDEKIVIDVLCALKNECSKREYCDPNCELYNHARGTCFLRVYPCHYELKEIEKRISGLWYGKSNGNRGANNG